MTKGRVRACLLALVLLHPSVAAAEEGTVAPSPVVAAHPWAPIAVIGSSLVSAVGLGAFAGFGASSQSTYDDLARTCGPASCGGAAQRALADDGKQGQTWANVGLGVAIGGAVLTALFVYLSTRTVQGIWKQ